ncbi:hypothetical protein ACFY65_23310 [Streptomyces cellulosae]|jgi:hypothetical protein
MDRYRFTFWLALLAPIVLGLIALALMALPGERSVGRMFLALGVYVLVAVVGGVAIARRMDR